MENKKYFFIVEYKDTKQKILKSKRELAKFINDPARPVVPTRGMSLRSIMRMSISEINGYNKKGLKISVIENDGKKRIHEDMKNREFERDDGPYIDSDDVKRYFIDLNILVAKRAIPIYDKVPPTAQELKRRKKVEDKKLLDEDIILQYDLEKKILDFMRDKKLITKRNKNKRYFKFVLLGRRDFRPTVPKGGDEIIGISSTVYLPFNAAYKTLTELIQKFYSGYNYDLYLVKIEIRYIDRTPPENQILFKSIKNTVKKCDIIDDIKNRLFNYYEEEEKKQYKNYLKIIKKYNFLSPSTYKNCLIEAALMGIYKKSNIDDNLRNILYKNNDNYEFSRTKKDLNYLVSKFKNIYFTVYHISSFGIEKTQYGTEENGEREIVLMIKAGHTILLYNDENFKNKIIEEEDDPFNDEIIKKKEEKKEYKERKILMATADLETCNKYEDNDDKLNQETGCYAWGFFDNNKKPYNNKERFEKKEDKYFIDDGTVYKENKDDDVLIYFMDFINNLKNDYVIFMHNGGKFDIQNFISYIIKDEYIHIYKFLESNGRIINIHIMNKLKKNIYFRDSYCFIPMSLDSACKDFKTSTYKLIDTVKHDLINVNNCYKGGDIIEDKVNDKKCGIVEYTQQYLKNDCKGLYEVMIKFRETVKTKFNIDILKCLTLAGIVRKYFIDSHYNNDIYYLKNTIDREIRKGYYGGRNEILSYIGLTENKKIYYNDFCSMFPSVMHDRLFPAGRLEILKDDEARDIKNINNYFGFVDCKFRNTNKNNLPLHAVKKNEKLTFAHYDNWERCILSTEEIKYSIDNNLGYEYKIKKIYNYNERKYLFKLMIIELFKYKKTSKENNDVANTILAKLLINSSYGYWGLNFLERDQNILEKIRLKELEEEKEDDTEEQKAIKRDKKIKYEKDVEIRMKQKMDGLLEDGKMKGEQLRVKDYMIYQTKDAIKKNIVNVGLAFYITSYARIKLYALITKIQRKGGTVYYTDTDSVISDYNIYIDDDFKSDIGTGGGELGELSNEADDIKKKIFSYYENKEKERLNLGERDNIPKETEKTIENNIKLWFKDYKGDKALHFNKLITLSNKCYYLKAEYEINGIKHKYEICKMKGMSTKKTFKYREIDHENKTIKYIELNDNKIYSKNKICEEDYDLLNIGYTLECDFMGFRAGFKSAIINGMGILKQENKKIVKRLYDKANIDENNIITPKVF